MRDVQQQFCPELTNSLMTAPGMAFASSSAGLSTQLQPAASAGASLLIAT
jgi:hypothetical protein